MTNLLLIDIFAMIDLEEDCRFRILKIEKHPVAAGDAERKTKGKSADFFDMQSGVAPILSETFFLNNVKALNFFGQFFKRSMKIISFDYFHIETGGYFLTAFW